MPVPLSPEVGDQVQQRRRRTGMAIVLDAHARGRLVVVLEYEWTPVLDIDIARLDVDGRLPLAAAGPEDGAPVRRPWGEERNAGLRVHALKACKRLNAYSNNNILFVSLLHERGVFDIK